MEKETLEEMSEITASNSEQEMSEVTTNDPYQNICVSCEG